jgi:polyhydroxyalkanoate synthesis regulator phasin
VKESNIQALTEDDLEKIGDQVKEVIDDVFQCVEQQQEEMNIKMQEKMVELCHMLETTRITQA